MNLGLAAASFAVVLPAELPDKTFLALVTLAARHRPRPVWIGAVVALVVQAASAAVAGHFIARLPRRPVEGVVAGVFLAGAAYVWLVSEGQETERASGVADAEDRRLAATRAASAPRVAFTTFGVLAIAEFGDLTQILIANMSARYNDALSVFVGACAAFLVTASLAVGVGSTVTRFVPLTLVRRISGLIFAVLGTLSAVSAAGG